MSDVAICWNGGILGKEQICRKRKTSFRPIELQRPIEDPNGVVK